MCYYGLIMTPPTWYFTARNLKHCRDDRLLNTLKRMGINVCLLPDMRKAHDPKYPFVTTPEWPSVAHVSIQERDWLLGASQWQRLFTSRVENFACSVFLDNWSQHAGHMLNRDPVMVPWGAFKRQWKVFLAWMGDSKGRVFIRPNGCSKTFTGTVVTQASTPVHINKLSGHITDGEMICITRAQSIRDEYRFVIVAGDVVASSPYRLNGEVVYNHSKVPDDAMHLAKFFANEPSWQPGWAYVVDIARTRRGQIKVIEINDVEVAGLYNCKMEPIVEALNDVQQYRCQLERYVSPVEEHNKYALAIIGKASRADWWNHADWLLGKIISSGPRPLESVSYASHLSDIKLRRMIQQAEQWKLDFTLDSLRQLSWAS